MSASNIILIGNDNVGRFKNFLSDNSIYYGACPDYRKMLPLFKKDRENFAVLFAELSDIDYMLALRDISFFPGKTHLISFIKYTPNGIVFGDPRRTEYEKVFNFCEATDKLYGSLLV